MAYPIRSGSSMRASGISNTFKKKKPYEVNQSQQSSVYQTPVPQSKPLYTPVPKITPYQQPIQDAQPTTQDRFYNTNQARIDQLKKRQAEDAASITARYAQSAKETEAQINPLEEYKKKQIKAYNTERKTKLAEQDTQAGNRLAEEAQAYRETQAGLENKFANLGTVDSGGYYGFTGANSRAATDFNKRQAEVRDTRDSNKKELDNYYSQLIDNETANFNTAIQQIRTQLANNPAQRDAEIQKALRDFEDKMYSVESEYNKQLMENEKSGIGKDVPAAQLSNLADYDNSMNALNGLYSTMQQYKSKIGPIVGRLGRVNQYDTDAQTFDAQMRAASQIVGKALEGGVLRKEDEEKYRKMLPQITDTVEVAQNKLDYVVSLVNGQRQALINAYEAGGYNPNKNAPQTPQVTQPAKSGRFIIEEL